MSLLKPEIGERCRCLQCGAEGPVGEFLPDRGEITGPFCTHAVDDAVICVQCAFIGSEPDYDVERIPEDT